MTLSVNLRKLLHRKSPEFCASLPNSLGTSAGMFVTADNSGVLPDNDAVFLVVTAATIYNYQPDDDAWMQLPSSGAAGAGGAGSCGDFMPASAPGGAITLSGTAGGSTTTLRTTLTLARDLAGCPVHIIGGAGAGYIGTVKFNTIGPNAVIVLDGAAPAATDATTQFRLYAGSLWFLNAGTPGGFAVYDRATNAWTQRSVAGLPSWFTVGQLISTCGVASNIGQGFASGVATAGGGSTLTDSAADWPPWTNYQIRITAGTGAGQIRTIASNTATVITVSAAWTTQPDATSAYIIEGNDDYLYLLGNGAVTLYRYSISANAWSTLAPSTARAGVMALGGMAEWIDAVPNADWDSGINALSVSGSIARQRGRYIYSFRGGNANTLDVYDIVSNTWINAHPYGGQFEVFTTGSSMVGHDGVLYIQKDATARVFKFDVAENAMEAFTMLPTPQGAAGAGDRLFTVSFREGGNSVDYLYALGQTRSELMRWVVI